MKKRVTKREEDRLSEAKRGSRQEMRSRGREGESREKKRDRKVEGKKEASWKSDRGRTPGGALHREDEEDK